MLHYKGKERHKLLILSNCQIKPEISLNGKEFTLLKLIREGFIAEEIACLFHVNSDAIRKQMRKLKTKLGLRYETDLRYTPFFHVSVKA